MRRGIWLAALLLTAWVLVSIPQSPAATATGRPNIVLILTDDQRWDSLGYMPNVEAMLVAHGVTFTNAFDNNPLCCPARSTILTGQTSGHNGVWFNNNADHGGFDAFEPDADETLPLWLHELGYRTALIGKFLNGYLPLADNPPLSWKLPGVDDWQAMLIDHTEPGKTGCQPRGYFGTCIDDNGVLETHTESDYSTDVIGDKAIDFIDSTPGGQPLFLYFAPHAPHLPTLPEAKYAAACSDVPLIRPPSYNVPIVNGPPYMQALGSMGGPLQALWDGRWIDDCRTLLSVDDQVARIVNALKAHSRLRNTLIMFASDNGFAFGEHRYRGKIVPYQESDRVPLVVRFGSTGTSGTSNEDLVTDMDYTATFLDAAGAAPPPGYQIDGASLLPLIGGAGTWTPHDALLVEHYGGTKVPAYCGVRTQDYLFTQYGDGSRELYDTRSDPYEMTNVAAANPSVVEGLLAETRRECDPAPPGWSW